MQVAKEILNQLGGNKFVVMTGAKNLVALENGLMFSIGRGAKKSINKVVVKLNSMDLYGMEFWNIRGANVKTVATAQNVYCDQLQEIFTKETGFYTSL